jgi:hypothetical protein
MAETREARRRRPKRPALYMILLTLGAVIALGSAWRAAHPLAPGPAGVVR